MLDDLQKEETSGLNWNQNNKAGLNQQSRASDNWAQQPAPKNEEKRKSNSDKAESYGIADNYEDDFDDDIEEDLPVDDQPIVDDN